MTDICNVSDLILIVLYTDDESVVIHGKYMSTITTILDHELYKLPAWSMPINYL